MIPLDGSQGEGGGQVLRSALALSILTGTPFQMERIRGGRKKPGLLRQHLTAVKAAARVGSAQVRGAELGSQVLSFVPGAPSPVAGGHFEFAVGSAGSAGLVLQTVLPPLLTARGPSTLILEGGTHNPFAPPLDFLQRSFAPLLARMGARVELRLERHGFYPAGGGRFHVEITPTPKLQSLVLHERGPVRARRATALVAHIGKHVGDREIRVMEKRLRQDVQPDGPTQHFEVRDAQDSAGPGNVVLLEIESEHVTEVFTSFGERRVRAETVARGAVDEALRYVEADVPVGEYLADQLLIPLAMAGAGSFRTLPLTPHTQTNIRVLQRFLPVRVDAIEEEGGGVRVEVRNDLKPEA